MEPGEILEVGSKYSKNELAKIIDQPNLAKVREGVFSCNNSASYLLFVDLEKGGKEAKFHFDDFFEGDYFHWDTQTTQHIETPKIQDIVNNRVVPHLFVRIKQKKKSKTLPFTYCGKLSFVEHEKGTAKPAHLIFQNLDYNDSTTNEELAAIYNWKPSKIGKKTKSNITKKDTVSEIRKRNFKPPNKTESSGLVTSRVGQGYFRQQIVEKWNGACAVTKCDTLPILIASHIVPWAECSEAERLDVENGILLSPNYDALFDKHLISFDCDGKIIVCQKLNQNCLISLGISEKSKIRVTEGMVPYLRRHNEKL